MAWREAIQAAQNRDIERRRMNPGVQNFGALVRTAMSQGMEQKKEERGEAAGARNAARSAIYQRHPQVAAEAAGMSIPGDGMVTGAPEGTELYQTTVDERGNPISVYRAPEKLDEPALANMYSKFISDIRTANAQNSVIPKYKPIPIPTYSEWKMEHFPEYAGGGGIITEGTPMTEAQAEDWLRQNGAPVTAANIQAVIQKFSK